MPEGDTVHKLAAALQPELCGQTLLAVEIRGLAEPLLSGRIVETVESKGKHLLIGLDHGWCLRSHLGLYGVWHRYRFGETWLKPARQATLVLKAAERIFVCFNAREVELLRASGFRRLDRINRLGPDLTRETPDPLQLRQRAMELLPPETPVVDVLLDQRVASGIGNVYKSEVLFVCRLSPLLCLSDLEPPRWSALYEAASALLHANLGRGPRVTRTATDGSGMLWVYGRAGRACFECGTLVQRARLGRNPRSTYWCPACQRPAARRETAG